jgi:hypothetical protein
MASAKFLGPFTGVSANGTAPITAADPLQFTMQKQQQSLWCWAAVAASVCQFLGDAGDNTEQCKVATMSLHTPCCINPMPLYGSSWAGNHEYSLSSCLDDLNHLAQKSAKVDIDSVSDQIKQDRPVCCHIRYASGAVAGHFVTIIGCHVDRKEVTLRDPDVKSPHNGVFLIDHIEQVLGGKWDETYFVK